MKTARILFCALFLGLLTVFGAAVLCRTPDAVSLSERRTLAAPPTFSLTTLADGSFFEDAERYLLDQFPCREDFRRLKAWVKCTLLGATESEGIAVARGHAAQINTVSPQALRTFCRRVDAIVDGYLVPAGIENVCVAVIPDAGYYLAPYTGQPTPDYAAIRAAVGETKPKSVDLFGVLTLDDFYKTDIHWRCERLGDTVAALLAAFGRTDALTVGAETVREDFYGVLYGRAALPMEPDVLAKVENAPIAGATCYRADMKTGALVEQPLYDTAKAAGVDPYDLYLGGACTVTVLENADGVGEGTLYLFGDSFARSLLPWFLTSYRHVVLYDLRYTDLSRVLETVPLEPGCDALLLYDIETLGVSDGLRVG